MTVNDYVISKEKTYIERYTIFDFIHSFIHVFVYNKLFWIVHVVLIFLLSWIFPIIIHLISHKFWTVHAMFAFSILLILYMYKYEMISPQFLMWFWIYLKIRKKTFSSHFHLNYVKFLKVLLAYKMHFVMLSNVCFLKQTLILFKFPVHSYR